MNQVACKLGGSLLLVASIASCLALACIGSEEPPVPPSPTVGPPPETVQDVTFKIGNLSDLTGVSSSAMAYVNMALEDMVKYFNENKLIPGVRLQVETYDGQMDPARDVPGYEWLRQKGADVIVSAIPAAPTSLKPRVDRDKVILFALSASREGYLPPGYVFNLGVDSKCEAYTILKWITDYDWDYKAKGPAKIGGASWSESYSNMVMAAMKEYCSAHPEQFEWKGGYLANFTFNWQGEVQALRDCDYVYPGIQMLTFVEQYREAGCTGAKFIGSDTQCAFFEMVDNAGLWDEIDGMLFLKSSRWWNDDDDELATLAGQLVRTNHPSEADRIIRSGNGYLAVNQAYAMLSIIADAVKKVGPQNLDSQAIYDAATAFKRTEDGVQRFSFGEDKRAMVDAYTMYEARGAEKNLFKVRDEWYPTVLSP